jgi:crotonobetainyl-CoA:carnitine CoA-transferase CaiB-like acyl-CoA transferase
MGGLMSITGAPGEGPMRVGIPVADLTARLFCAIGILTALLEREVSGEGPWLQTSLLQAQIFMLDFQASRWLMEKEVAKQAGNNHPTSIPTGVFKTSDGYINIATTGGRIWERCAQAIGAGAGYQPNDEMSIVQPRPDPSRPPIPAGSSLFRCAHAGFGGPTNRRLPPTRHMQGTREGH